VVRHIRGRSAGNFFTKINANILAESFIHAHNIVAKAIVGEDNGYRLFVVGLVADNHSVSSEHTHFLEGNGVNLDNRVIIAAVGDLCEDRGTVRFMAEPYSYIYLGISIKDYLI
jgi:bisphosphoglycerate-independent phosphoglycerate mutase (AlkP superfamily)